MWLPETGLEQAMRTRKRKELGQYIVADPAICHGQLTFKGTRILVSDMLYLLAKGWDWDRISAAYDGRLSREAIAEAIELARESLLERTEKRRRVVPWPCRACAARQRTHRYPSPEAVPGRCPPAAPSRFFCRSV